MYVRVGDIHRVYGLSEELYPLIAQKMANEKYRCD